MHDLAGVVTVPLILTAPAGNTGLNLSDAERQHQISVALIASGILSAIQITRFKLFGKYYLGKYPLDPISTGI